MIKKPLHKIWCVHCECEIGLSPRLPAGKFVVYCVPCFDDLEAPEEPDEDYNY